MIVKQIKEVKIPKLVDGTLPDIDTDFCSKDREAVKQYMEDRFGRRQVCSVGTYSKMGLKSLIKDLARTTDVDYSQVNLMTSMFTKDDVSFIDMIKRALVEPKMKAFMKENSEIFHMVPTLLDQPKTQGIHACALIIFPDVMTVSEWAPMRTQKGLIVSEWDGYEMDDAGFLKDDILGLKQLDKFDGVLSLIKNNGKEVPDIYNLEEDEEVYRYFSNGWNGDVFQMGSSGLTEYCRSMKPRSINDLIAANALYRPGPMENHYHTIYYKCKNEGRAPEYLWGTEEITKDTFGLLVYQEQVMKIFTELGGLTLKESDDVRRAIGKKKVSILKSWKGRVLAGFLERGSTQEQFEEIWNVILEFAKYSFNKSHSAAYALTGYICQWLKVHYPIEYWTVSLTHANEDSTLVYLSEIIQAGKIKIRSVDINNSGVNMTDNQETSTIFWGIESIKGIGEATAMQIIDDRRVNGHYKSFADFYFRHSFKGSKVKKQTFEALIASGAFDILYGFEGQEERRWLLLNRFRRFRRVKPSNPKRDLFLNGETDKRWWWNLQEKKYTGLADINYAEICLENGIENAFVSNLELSQRQRGITRAFGGYVIEVKERRSKNGKFAIITIENNYKFYRVLAWTDEYEQFKDQIKGSEGSLVVFTGQMTYEEKWTKGNQFTLRESSQFLLLE